MNGYLIALDQGTTSSRAIVFDAAGGIVSLAQYPFEQIYPQPGWVEHDPMEILGTQLHALEAAFEKSGLSPTDIAGIGITNQRETTIVWEKATGKPIYNAIVWQCRRTAPAAEQLIRDGMSEHIRSVTGRRITLYVSLCIDGLSDRRLFICCKIADMDRAAVKKIQPSHSRKALYNALPAAFHFAVDLAHAVLCSAAGAVDKAL